MSYTTGNVMDSAAALLNDAGKALYTYVVQFPYLKIAYRELELIFTEYGLMSGNFVNNSTLLAGAVVLTSPGDFFIPVSLEERDLTSTDENDFVEMVEKEWEPSTQKTDTLKYWTFRTGNVYFVGATKDKTIRLRYKRTLETFSNVNGSENINLQGGQNYLEMRTAALCAEFIGGVSAQSRANSLNAQAGIVLDSIKSILVKATQQNRVRRLPFRVRTASASSPIIR